MTTVNRILLLAVMTLFMSCRSFRGDEEHRTSWKGERVELIADDFFFDIVDDQVIRVIAVGNVKLHIEDHAIGHSDFVEYTLRKQILFFRGVTSFERHGHRIELKDANQGQGVARWYLDEDRLEVYGLIGGPVALQKPRFLLPP